MKTPSDARRAPGIGLWICTALVVGNMIGSGVFLLPSSLAPYGGISMVGWVVSAAGAVCLALVFARLGRFLPRLGGPYAYAHYGFGEFGGFLVAWAYWISMWTTNAALAVAFISYSTVFWPALATTPALAAGAAIGSLWLLTVVNAAGVRTAGIVQLVTTILKLLPLIAIATLGLLYFNADHFVPFNPSGQTTVGAVAATVTLTLWAFLGLESGTVPAADVRDPERTIPRATIMGTLIAATVYILGTAAVMGIIAPTTLASSTAPYADAAHSIWGSWGRYLLAIGATISCFGCLNGWILLSGQLPRAAALDGLLPAAFTRLSGRGTPVFGLVISSVIATVLIFMNYTRGLVGAFTFLILLATLATLVPYVVSSMTELLVAVRRGFTGGLRSVLGPVAVAVAAFIYSVVAVIGSGRDAVYWGFVLILAGLPIYVAMISRRRSPT
jgi:APA family basic amino acid/polyamine antiporter